MNSVHVTEVEAGDRLKVGWVSNNHGGGYARIALVPWEDRRNAQSYKNNVMKFACYGHDERPGRYGSGDCKHPCNARPGCEYQSSMTSLEIRTSNISFYPIKIGHTHQIKPKLKQDDI